MLSKYYLLKNMTAPSGTKTVLYLTYLKNYDLVDSNIGMDENGKRRMKER